MSLSAPASRIRTSRLSRPDRLLLWAIRAWVIGLKRRLDVAPPLAVAFDRVGVPECAELVDALMSIVACGAVRTLAVECVCEAGVSADESRLLAAAGLYQQGRSFEARFLLREILTPEASCDAGQLLERLGAVLTAGNLGLSTWTIDIEQFVFGSAPKQAKEPVRPTIH
jgi:hypothetical protein